MADLDTRGNVKQFRGDPDFVRFWNEMLEIQTDLFGVIFPVKSCRRRRFLDESRYGQEDG